MADAIHLTFRYRVKDATTGKWLERHARAVNYVWNFCVTTQREAQSRRALGADIRWPSAFDLIRLTTGCAAELGLHSDTVAAICRQFVASRDAKRKCPRWRERKSLGWVPFIPRAVQVAGNAVTYKERSYRLWLSRPIEGNIVSGAFACDARGRWYASFTCEVAAKADCGSGEVGIDLGLTTLATLSSGETIENPKHFARYEAALAAAQRAGNKRRAKAIHARIANARQHHLHEVSTRLVRENRRIVVGKVGAEKLKRTRMAKSVSDAGWSTLRYMLRYKASRHGADYVEADERWSSATCSACGSRSGPRGLAGLRVRCWMCECGVVHDRDVNAASNILAGAERRPPGVEIPVL